jgi:hypothetical protein
MLKDLQTLAMKVESFLTEEGGRPHSGSAQQTPQWRPATSGGTAEPSSPSRFMGYWWTWRYRVCIHKDLPVGN